MITAIDSGKIPMSNEKRNQGSSYSISTSSISNRDPNPCPICLASIPYLQESYLDHCLHKFCYKCIVQWSKVISSKLSNPPTSVSCPICKTENSALMYGYDGSSFERHSIQQIHTNSIFISEAHRYRLRCYHTEPGALGDKFNIQRFWKSQKFLQPNRWLQPWLRREIQALIQEEDVEIIMHHILGTIDSFRLRKDNVPRSLNPPEETQNKFKEVVSGAARPFLSGRTERFVEEMEGFLASGLSLKAYDEVYMQQLEWIWNAGEGKKVSPAEVQSGVGTAVLDLFICDEDDDGSE